MSNTEFGEKLESAIENSNFFARSYVWKGKKEKDENGNLTQEIVNLMEASEQQLRGFYNHCNSMLYNQDRQNPGRRPLLDLIQSQKDRCGVELYLRESEADNVSRYTILESIKKTMMYNGMTNEQAKSLALKEFVIVHSQYINLPIKLVQEGCMQRLGKFDKSHITLTFILKQGLKISESEEQELTEYMLDDRGNSIKRNYIEVVRERLNIADHMKIKLDPKGLSYTQLRAMMTLKSRYYNELTSEQLRTLRNRILFSLEDDIMFHIEQWEERIHQIREVAEIKGITL
jgi:hypothetical protein